MKLFTVLHQHRSDGLADPTPAELAAHTKAHGGEGVALLTVFATFVSPALEYKKLVQVALGCHVTTHV